MLRQRVPLAWFFTLVFASSPVLAEPLRVGVETDLVPITFVKPDGQPTGFAIDLIDAVAREAGLEIVYVVKPRLEMFADFHAGRVDALANVVHTKDRDATMAFSTTHLELRNTVFVRRGGPLVVALTDLRDVRIAGIPKSRGQEYLDDHALAYRFIPVPTVREALHAIQDGKADATVATRLFAAQILKDDVLRDVASSPLELPELTYGFHIALHPDDRLRLAAINEGLMRVRQNGTYDRIYEKWIGPLEPRPLRFKDVQPYLLPTAAVLIAVAVVLLWQRRMLRLLAEQTAAARRSEERLMLVLEGGDHGLWNWDLTTDKVERNARTTTLLGYTENEVPTTQAGWLTLVHPEDRSHVDTALNQIRTAGRDSFSVQYRVQAKDGQWRWLNSRGKVLERDTGGRPLRAAGTHTDVTALKRMEEERVAFQQKVLEAQKLESLGLLAGGIAHDFNNLLTVILGQATFMRVSDNEPGSIESSVHQIESAARRAADLCRQMLVYAGGGSFTMQPVDLNALITGIGPLLRHSVRKDARLEFELAPELPPVEADPAQVRQIVMNLVINASEALKPNGGTIRISTVARAPNHAELREAVHVTDLPVGRRVCLSVQDNGSGMPPATRAKIFEPFFTTKFTGRGLGLPSVLGIVRAHRGIFSVHSEEGVGSTFSLFLAVSTRSVPESTSFAVGLAKPAARAALLIADDEPAVLTMSLAVLRHHGYQVVSATSGREAVESFEADPGRFGAVVLDFTMPELNGVGALMEIRKIRPNIPAVLMSGFGAADTFEQLPPENPPLFLQKPFTQHELLARVAEAIALGTNSTDAAMPRT